MHDPDFVPLRTPPTPPARNVDWPRLLQLAAQLGVNVYRPDSNCRLTRITEPPTTTEARP